MDQVDLTRFLQAQALPGEVIRLPVHTPTVETAARAVGATPERIVKSILFLADGLPVLVITNGTARIDYKRLADHLGLSRKRLRLADADTVRQVAGFEVGAMPPFGHKVPLRTLVDAQVLEQPEVYAGGGAIDALLRIPPREIVRAARAEVVRLTRLETESPPSQEAP